MRAAAGAAILWLLPTHKRRRLSRGRHAAARASQVDSGALPALDKREQGYERIALPVDHFDVLSPSAPGAPRPRPRPPAPPLHTRAAAHRGGTRIR